MIRIFLISETELQKLFIIVPWAAIAYSFILKSSIDLVVSLWVSFSDATRMSALSKVKKSIFQVVSVLMLAIKRSFGRIQPSLACLGVKNSVSQSDFWGSNIRFSNKKPRFPWCRQGILLLVNQNLLLLSLQPFWLLKLT